MKKKQNMMAKILAGFALFGILISIVGTALLVITSDNWYQSETRTVTSEELQQLIDTDNIQVTTASGSQAEVNVVESEESGVLRGVEK